MGPVDLRVCVLSVFFFWAVEDQRCGEALELGGHGHRNPPRCHADTRSDLDHDSGIPLQISTEIRTMYPNHVKRWGPHPERCPRLSRQAGQQGILTEPHIIHDRYIYIMYILYILYNYIFIDNADDCHSVWKATLFDTVYLLSPMSFTVRPCVHFLARLWALGFAVVAKN